MKTRTPIFCLTGAGVNPNLLTSALTNDLLTWDEFRDPTGTLDTTGCVSKGDGDTRTPYFEWVRSHISKSFKYPSEANFEDLIHMVELAASEGMADRVEPGWLSFARAYGSDLFVPNQLTSEIARNSGTYVAHRACIHILKRVKERTENVHLPAARLLGKLDETGYTLRVFSLNYDSLVAERLPGVPWTGYGADTGDGAEFNLSPSYPSDQHLHVQLHGSTNFGSAEIRLDRVTPFRRFNDQNIAEETWDSVSSHGNAMDRHPLPNVPMITGRRKPDRILQEPFASYHHYLRRAAFETPNWLILGYGAGDIHINGVLQSAMEYWGGRLRIFVCNYLDDTLCDYDCPNFYRVGSGDDAHDTVFGRTGFASVFDFGARRFHEARISLKRPARLGRGFANALNETTLLTVDGKYENHEEKIRYWFERKPRT